MKETFSWLLSLNTTKKLESMYKTNVKKTEIREGNSAMDLGTKGQHGGEFPGFYFCFIYFRLQTE